MELINMFDVLRPEVDTDATNVVLEISGNSAVDWEAKDDEVEAAINFLDGAMNSLANATATEAKAIFEDHLDVQTVEAAFNVGGCELTVTTHRDFGDDDGSTIQYFTQGRLNTSIGADILEATAGIWE